MPWKFHPEWGHQEQRFLCAVLSCLAGEWLAVHSHPTSISCPPQVPGLAWGSQKVSEAWRWKLIAHQICLFCIAHASPQVWQGRTYCFTPQPRLWRVSWGWRGNSRAGASDQVYQQPRRDFNNSTSHQDSLHTQALMSQAL